MLNHVKHRQTGVAVLGGFLGVGAAMATGMLVGRSFGVFFGVLLAVPAFYMVQGATKAALGKLFKPNSPEAQWEYTVYAALDRFEEAKTRRGLSRAVDPVANQLLDAAAFYWERIQTLLDGPYWTSSNLSVDAAATRAEILKASNLAMDELAVLCAGCIGEPPTTRKDEFSQMVKDFTELRMDDAFERLAYIADGNEGRFVHQSPHLQAIFHPARNLAERLKLLCEEVERYSSERATQTLSGTLHEGTNQIDSLIQNLQMQRNAAEELRRGLEDQAR